MNLREQLAQRKVDEPPACVSVSYSNPLALSVCLPDGETWVLAWSRFGHARLRDDELTLMFIDHEVVVRGQNLQRIMEDLTRLRIEGLRAIPSAYPPEINPRKVVINKIEVRPVQF